MTRPVAHRANLVMIGLLVLMGAGANARGDILVASMDADAVLRFDDSGSPLGVFASHPSLDGAASITYGSDGNLYVLGEFSHNVLRFHGATGAFIDTFISSATMSAVGLGDPGFMEFGPDGNLYILHHISPAPDAVWRFDGATGAFISLFASGSGMAHTHGLDFGPDGTLYLGNLDTNVIEKYDTTGAFIGAIGPDPDGKLHGTSSLVYGPDDRVYATTVAGGVRVGHPPSGAAGEFVAGGPGDETWGLLIDGSTVYVGYHFVGAIRKYDLTGAYLGDFVAPGGVTTPFDMEVLVPEPPAVLLMLIAMSAPGLLMNRRLRNRERQYN